jgi:hypothetical protein
MREAGTLLEDYYRRHPATKYALLHLAEQLSNDHAALVAAGSALPKTWEDHHSRPIKKPNS